MRQIEIDALCVKAVIVLAFREVKGAAQPL